MANGLLTISIIFGLISPIIAIVSIFKGEYKPQRISKLIFTITTGIATATLFFQDDRTGLFLAIVSCLNSSIILLLSFKYGIGGNNRNDIFILGLAMLTLLVWQTTKDAEIALYFSILTDFCGVVPSLIKAYQIPYSEDWRYYLADMFAGFFNLTAVPNLGMHVIAYPFYIFLANLIMVVVILGRRNKLKKVIPV